MANQQIETIPGQIILQIILCLLIILFTSTAMAETGRFTTKSISYSNKAEIDKTARNNQFKQSAVNITKTQANNGIRSESIGTEYYASDYTIYDVSTELVSDFNYDGFYHRFAISIDADTVYESAYVYVRLSISYEGGPWNAYASSDVYSIYGNSGSDRFSIETELADGFVPGYYDIRIELYNADNDQFLLSYGPYNDASLNALPLESSDYDESYRAESYQNYNEQVIVYGQGAMDYGLLAGLFLILLIRLLNIGSQQKNPEPSVSSGYFLERAESMPVSKSLTH